MVPDGVPLQRPIFPTAIGQLCYQPVSVTLPPASQVVSIPASALGGGLQGTP